MKTMSQIELRPRPALLERAHGRIVGIGRIDESAVLDAYRAAGGNFIPLMAVSNADQLEDNLGAAGLELASAQVARLDNAA